MKLFTLFSVLRCGSFRIYNHFNDSLIAYGDVYFYGSGTNFSFDETFIDKSILLSSLVCDIYPCQNHMLNIYVDLEA